MINKEVALEEKPEIESNHHITNKLFKINLPYVLAEARECRINFNFKITKKIILFGQIKSYKPLKFFIE